jgi:hypothetical protein
MRRNAAELRRVILREPMLRPSDSFLSSSRAARRANVRAERVKWLGHAVRGVRSSVNDLFGGVIELLILCCLPLVYFVASYLSLDLPFRWLARREPLTGQSFLLFFVAAAISLVGVARAMQHATPVAPVRPRFARAMLGLAWLAALLMTVGDLLS